VALSRRPTAASAVGPVSGIERQSVTLVKVGPGCYATPDRRFRVSKRESGWEVLDTTGCRLIGNDSCVSNRAEESRLADIRRDIDHVLWQEALVAARDAREAWKWTGRPVVSP